MAKLSYWGIVIGMAVAVPTTIVAFVVSPQFGREADLEEQFPHSRPLAVTDPEKSEAELNQERPDEQGPYPALVDAPTGSPTDQALAVQDRDLVLGIEIGGES